MEMVSEAKVNGSEAEAPTELPPALAEKPAGLPPGKYSLVGWDMDTTGRRLIDEICQIAAYTPKQQYSQYIMPYGDLNPGARRRHNVRVVTVGRYRMLKDTNTHKILKTKSEISALTDFLDWLEKEKGDGSVILIYHEPRRLSPTMLLEALTRYKLLDRFKSIVAGFADSYALAADKCKATVKSVSLRVLARVLLDADSLAVDSALDRAAAAYRIVEHLAQAGGGRGRRGRRGRGRGRGRAARHAGDGARVGAARAHGAGGAGAAEAAAGAPEHVPARVRAAAARRAARAQARHAAAPPAGRRRPALRRPVLRLGRQQAGRSRKTNGGPRSDSEGGGHQGADRDLRLPLRPRQGAQGAQAPHAEEQGWGRERRRGGRGGGRRRGQHERVAQLAAQLAQEDQQRRVGSGFEPAGGGGGGQLSPAPLAT